MSTFKDIEEAAKKGGFHLDSCGTAIRYRDCGGHYIDLCGMSPEDAKNATILHITTGETTLKANKISFLLDEVSGDTQINATPTYAPASDVNIVVNYSGVSYSGSIAKGTTATAIITMAGKTGVTITTSNITLNPSQDTTYRYTPEIIEPSEEYTIYYGPYAQKDIESLSSKTGFIQTSVTFGETETTFTIPQWTGKTHSAMTDSEWEEYKTNYTQTLVYLIPKTLIDNETFDIELLGESVLGSENFHSIGNITLEGIEYAKYVKYSVENSLLPRDDRAMNFTYNFIIE